MTLVASAQLELQVGECERNRRAGLDAIRDAAACGAQVVVLPELSDTGYVLRDQAEALALCNDERTLDEWVASAREHDVVIIGGLCGRRGEVVTNSAAIVDGSGLLARYDKVHLWDREPEIFAAGDRPAPVVDTAHGKIAVMVCYDLEFPEWVRLAAEAGADLIAAPVNWPALDRPDGAPCIELVKVQAMAATYGVFIAVADRCGDERGVSWTSGTCIVDRTGGLLAHPRFENAPGLFTAEIELTAARDKRLGERNHLADDRRPDLYR